MRLIIIKTTRRRIKYTTNEISNDENRSKRITGATDYFSSSKKRCSNRSE